MERILMCLKGYVKISVRGAQMERFLNLCKSRDIIIKDLCCKGRSYLTGSISVPAYFLLRPIRNKTKVHICVLEKRGLPFFFYRRKKRKAFFLGFFLCALLICMLSGRIWNIHIEGNSCNSTPEIIHFLNSMGVEHGISKKKVNCSEISAMVRQNFPETTWVSAKIEGTRLFLTIQEGIMDEEIENTEEMPCNIVADQEGTVVKIITRAGVPLVKPGDVCKKGDILVLGRLDMKNDNQEIYHYEYVHADADIYLERCISYYDSFEMNYKKKVWTGEQKKGFYLKAGDIYLGAENKKKDNWILLTEEFPLRITENFVLPFSLGRVTHRKYQFLPTSYTKEEAEILASDHLKNFQKKLMEKGVQISANDVKIETDYKSCISRGKLTIIEKVGKDVSVDTLKQP